MRKLLIIPALILWLCSCSTQTKAQDSTQWLNYKPKILLVTAHPDDDALYSATVFKTTHLLHGKVDLAVMTNGEGGYHYSTLGDYIYDRQLDKEKIGREYLPAIRKRELMAGGKIVGIRNYFFFDQVDRKYSEDISNPLSRWDTTWVKRRLVNILKDGHYDFVFTMMPKLHTHAHHKASAILALESIQKLPKDQRPIVFATDVASSMKDSTDYSQLKGYPISKLMENVSPMRFDRTQTFGYHNRMNYKIIANWVIAEHKSQGTMQMLMNKGNVEQYWPYAIDSKDELPKARAFFKAVNDVPIYHNPNINFDNE
ncbi:MAG TPA: PIG-L family deacetylase [Balneolaceae bacterium]|nr:PIG-L family deacetylase [Balneolaceae bacterium]